MRCQARSQSATLLRMRLDLALCLRTFLLSGLLMEPQVSPAQPPPGPPPATEVHQDRSVTFRYKDPGAAKVSLELEGRPQSLAMSKDADGVWTVTTSPLAPEIYGYHFEADGQPRLDPGNTRLTTNLVNVSNMIEVRGAEPEPWEMTAVPHGTLHHHFYDSHVVTGLTADQSDFYVYTPPGYDASLKQVYPVLYLLHGWSDAASGWTAVGQANLILDNLLAAGKIKPMILVMPLGYGEMSFAHDYGVWNQPALIDRNVAMFSQALLSEVMPRVEAGYKVSRQREDRAVAGLSMGGLEALSVGLLHTDKFAYVGGFSSAIHNLNYESELAGLNPKTADLRLLWIACGRDDHLLATNLKLIEYLKKKQMPVTAIETPGMHTWMVWRDNLIHFAPLLFQSAPSR